MKNYGTKSIACFFAALMLFISCDTPDNVSLENQVNAKSSNQFLEDSYNLSENESFREFVAFNIDFSTRALSSSQYMEFDFEGEYTQEEVNVLAQSLDYNNGEEVSNLFLTLQSNYEEFSSLSFFVDSPIERQNRMIQEGTQILLISGVVELPNPPEYETLGNNPCLDRYNNDTNIALGLYAVTVAGCAAAGIAIGTANFWNAGAVGIIVGAACVAGAMAVLDGQMDNARLDLEACLNT